MRPLLLALTAATTVAASPPRPGPSAVDIIAVDTSGSMRDRDAGRTRLEVALAGARKAVHAAGPSADHPVVIIAFTDTAVPAVTFTDRAAAERYLDTFRAAGGTRIALGLKEAATAVARYRNVPRMTLQLFTDGEDGDLAGIGVVQDELKPLFASRQQNQLSTAVFLRCWSDRTTVGIGGPFQGVATVRDLRTSRLTKVTVTPAVRLVGTAWTDPGRTVEVTLEATATPAGGDALSSVLTLTGPAGPAVTVPTDGRPRVFTVVLPVGPVEFTAGTTAWAATAAVPVWEPSPDGVFQLALAADRVAVGVPLPPHAVAVTLRLKATAVRWVRLADDTAEARLELTWTATPALVRPAALKLVVAGGRVTAGDSLTADGGGGTHTAAVRVRLAADRPARLACRLEAAADPRQPITAAAAEADVTGPEPVTVGVGLSGRRPAVLRASLLARGVDWRAVPIGVPDRDSDGLWSGLTLEPVADGGEATPAGPRPAADAGTVVAVRFDRPSPFFDGETQRLSVSFRPPAGTTSVIAGPPLRLAVTRDPGIVVWLAGGLLVAIVALIGGCFWLATRRRIAGGLVREAVAQPV